MFFRLSFIAVLVLIVAKLYIKVLMAKGAETYSWCGEVKAEGAAEFVGREVAGDERDEQ